MFSYQGKGTHLNYLQRLSALGLKYDTGSGGGKALESWTSAQPSDDSSRKEQSPFLGGLALSTQRPVRKHWGSMLEPTRAGRAGQAERVGTAQTGDECLRGLAEP